MPKARKKLSLRTRIVVLVFCCGALPILLLSLVSAYISNRAANRHVDEVITVSIENAMDSVRRDLDTIVDSSLSLSYVPTVRTSYSAYLRDGDGHALYASLNQFLTEYYGNDGCLRAAYLLFTGDVPGHRFFTRNARLMDYAEVEDFYKNGSAEAITLMVEELGTEVAFYKQDGRLYLVRALSLLEGHFQSYAALALEIHQPLLFESLESLPWIETANMTLGGTEITLGRQSGLVQPDDTSLFATGAMEGNRYTMQYTALADTSALRKDQGNTWLPILIMGLLSIPLLLLLYGFFRNRIRKPLHELGALAHSIENGAFGAQIDLTTLNSAETYDLGLCMNAMSQRLEEQFEHIYREELALRDAEIKALQSQINPHFLGNTLEIINWEARFAGNVKVSRMLEALSTMLEGALDRKKRPVIHLSEEMMYTNSYLYIIGERLGKRLAVTQEIDDNLLDWFVPRLILQPIVENAVEHGLTARAEGSITIRALRENESWMRLEVENNRPLSKEEQQNIEKLLVNNGDNAVTSLNIGIRNVHQRLRLLYGPESGLTVKTTKNGGTVSSMRIGKGTGHQF